MASPQKEHGFTTYSVELDSAVTSANLPKYEARVMQAMRKQLFYGPAELRAATLCPTEIAKTYGYDDSNIRKAIRNLIAWSVIERTDSSPNAYRFIKDYERWNRDGQPLLSAAEMLAAAMEPSSLPAPNVKEKRVQMNLKRGSNKPRQGVQMDPTGGFKQTPKTGSNEPPKQVQMNPPTRYIEPGAELESLELENKSPLPPKGELAGGGFLIHQPEAERLASKISAKFGGGLPPAEDDNFDFYRLEIMRLLEAGYSATLVESGIALALATVQRGNQATRFVKSFVENPKNKISQAKNEPTPAELAMYRPEPPEVLTPEQTEIRKRGMENRRVFRIKDLYRKGMRDNAEKHLRRLLNDEFEEAKRLVEEEDAAVAALRIAQ